MSTKRIVQALLVAAAVVVGAIVATSAGSTPYVVRAEFADAAGLRKDFRVTLGGVTVGKVAKVTLSRDDTAIATLDLDRSAGPVGRDAQASVIPTNLLGEKVVQLAPGDLRTPAPSGALIPRSRTSTPVELDDVFDTFDTPTRTALGIFFAEQGQSLIGRGADLAQTLAQLPPSLQDTRAVLANLSADNRALGDLVDRSDRIVATFARQRRPLGRIVDSAGAALATLGSREAGLAGTIRNAPGAITQLHSTLDALQRTAAPLAPAARGLRRAAPALTAALRELPPFASAAQPTLRTLTATAPSLRRLAREGAPVVRRLVPAAGQLSTFARTADPVLGALDEARDDIMGLIEGWARATQSRDALGHVFRVEATVTGDLSALLKDYLQPQRTAARRGPHRPAAPSAQPAAPVKSPATTVPKLKLPPVHVPPIVPEVTDKVTALLDYLLK